MLEYNCPVNELLGDYSFFCFNDSVSRDVLSLFVYYLNPRLHGPG